MNILLIQADATTPSTADQACEDWLNARYGASGTISTGTITTRDDSSSAHSLTGIDLIVIGPNADQSQVSTKYQNKSVPAVTLAGACFRQTVMDLQVGSNGSAEQVTQINIVDSAHALADGLSSGNNTIYTASTFIGRLTSNTDLPSGAAEVARSTTPTACIWGIDSGGTLGSGATANSRQVAWGPGRDFGSGNTNSTWDGLLEAAVSWATTVGGGGAGVVGPLVGSSRLVGQGNLIGQGPLVRS